MNWNKLKSRCSTYSKPPNMTEANHNAPCHNRPQKGKLIIFSEP